MVALLLQKSFQPYQHAIITIKILILKNLSFLLFLITVENIFRIKRFSGYCRRRVS